MSLRKLGPTRGHVFSADTQRRVCEGSIPQAPQEAIARLRLGSMTLRGPLSGVAATRSPGNACRRGGLLARRSNDVEMTAGPRSVGESLVGRSEDAVQGFGESDVARFVRRGVVSQLPCTAQEWCGRVDGDGEVQQISDRVFACAAVSAPPHLDVG